MATVFIGRQDELRQLSLLLLGKSRLIYEFGKNHRFLKFSGVPPTAEMDAQSQRDWFYHQLSRQLNLPIPPGGWRTEFWGDLFDLLAQNTQEGRCIILFDEISWMGSLDPTFLGQLKDAWDQKFSQNRHLILFLCGSVSTWIEKNIIKSTGFYGRISHYMTVDELTLQHCNQFLRAIGFPGTAHEKLKILSITGGIPWYLEQINPLLSADENIRNLCFRKDGLLVQEFNLIFHDLFSKQSEIYKRLISLLSEGAIELNEIFTRLSYEKSGIVSQYLDNLIQARFVERDYTWHIKTGKASRLSHFRLCDNYIRFYLRYIEPNLSKINRDAFREVGLSSLQGWDSIMGFQFENLVLKNRHLIWRYLHCRPEDVVYDNPHFQRPTTTTPGCQIDYLIQTRQNLLFVCEIYTSRLQSWDFITAKSAECTDVHEHFERIRKPKSEVGFDRKFSRREIKAPVIEDMKNKIHRLAIPKGFACVPILIHIHGVDDKVLDAGYFHAVIDFGELLEEGGTLWDQL